MGDEVESDTDEDFVEPEPDLLLDGEPLIVRSEWSMLTVRTRLRSGWIASLC